MATQRKIKKIEKKELIEVISKATGVRASRIKPYSVKNLPNSYTVATRTKKDYIKIHNSMPINHGERQIDIVRTHPFPTRNAGEYTIRLQTVAVPSSDEPPIQVNPYPWEKQNNKPNKDATKKEKKNQEK